MSKNAGVRVLVCPICGNSYRRTNWMRRHGGVATHRGESFLLSDTHLIGCHRKSQARPGGVGSPPQ
jgi:hypothetical protein